MPAPDLQALTRDLADELGDVDVTSDAGVSHYARGAVFARASRGALEVRLPEDIADAALRTSETAPGAESGGWVRFAPTSDAQHVIDRAEAWFRTAWRHARSG